MTLASRRKEIAWKENVFEGSGNPNFSGGAYVDDKGYIRVLRSDHPYNNRGYVYAHRLVFEAHHQRYLQPWETLHHINELKLDNRIENLFLTTVKEHSWIHRIGKTKTLADKTNLRVKARQRKVKDRTRNAGKFC